MKYCIVSDLDGTFFDSSAKPAPANLEAITRFVEEGNYFTVATGRYGKIAFDLAEYCSAPMIVCNGACLYDIESGDIFDVHSFPCEKAYEMIADIHFKYPAPRVRYTDSTGVHYLFEEEQTDIEGQWFKVVFESAGVSADDTKYRRADLMAIDRYVSEKYGGIFRANFSMPYLYELLQHGASKGIAIEGLRRYYAGRGEDVKLVAVGDYENDAEMLKAADIAACPSNSLPEIIELVQSRGGIITADNNSGAIASLIEKLKTY